MCGLRKLSVFYIWRCYFLLKCLFLNNDDISEELLFIKEYVKTKVLDDVLVCSNVKGTVKLVLDPEKFYVKHFLNRMYLNIQSIHTIVDKVLIKIYQNVVIKFSKEYFDDLLKGIITANMVDDRKMSPISKVFQTFLIRQRYLALLVLKIDMSIKLNSFNI